MTGAIHVGMIIRNIGEEGYFVVQEIKPWDRTIPSFLVRVHPASSEEIAMYEVMYG